MNVKLLRERMGITQQELAFKLGVSIATISRWETGAHKPSRLAASKIERAAKRISKRRP